MPATAPAPFLHNPDLDKFCKCVIDDNFGFEVTNDRLIFDDCAFNYTQLQTDAILKVMPGIGSFDFFDCRFLICRLGNSNANRLILFNANTGSTDSFIQNCRFESIIDGSNDFIMIDIAAQQFIKITDTCFIFKQVTPDTVIVGHATPVTNIRLYINKIDVIGIGKLIFMQNLWSGSIADGIAILFGNCIINDALLLKYTDAPPVTFETSIIMKNIGQNNVLHNKPSVAVILDQNSVFQLIVDGCLFNSALNQPLFQYKELVPGTNEAIIRFTNSSMRNSAMGVTPPWLEDSFIDIFTLNQNSVSLEGYAIAFVGGGIFNDNPLSTTLS